MLQLGAFQRSAQIFAHVAILKIKFSVKIQPAPDLGKVMWVSPIFWKSSTTQHEESQVQASRAPKRTHAPVTGLHREPKLEGRRGILEFWGWLAENVKHNTAVPHRHTAGRCQMLHDKKEGTLTRKKKQWHLQRVMSSFQSLSQIWPWHSLQVKSFCALSMIK